MIWLAILGMLLKATEQDDFSAIMSLPGGELAVGVIGSGLALSISEQSLKFLDCSFDGVQSTLDMYPSMVCWEGKYIVRISPTLLPLLIFLMKTLSVLTYLKYICVAATYSTCRDAPLHIL